MNIHNPYDGEGIWLKGCLHTHTTCSDGKYSPEELLNRYGKQGYDFISITDHERITVQEHPTMVMIPGIEVSLPGARHLLGIGMSTPPDTIEDTQEFLDTINATGALAIVAHPNQVMPSPGFIWSAEDILGLRGIHGLEIYNYLSDLFFPHGYALDKWDYVLSQGVYPCWGIAVDDTHGIHGQSNSKQGHQHDMFGGWIAAQCRTRTRSGVMDALRRGAFYASTGVHIETIRLTGPSLLVAAADAHQIHYIGDGGRVLHTSEGNQGRYDIEGGEKYVRVECHGDGGTTAWTQPLLIG